MALVGKPITRVEDQRFLTGAGTYLPNHSFSGSLHVVYVRSTMAHARILGVDVEAARTAPGVTTVVTAADLGLEPIMPDQAGLGVNPMMLRPWLAEEVVRYVGEPVAAVVADSQARAVDAAELVEVDYEALPVVTGVRQARTDEVLLFPDAGTNIAYELGDELTPDLFDGCEVVVSAEIRNQRVAPCPLEVRTTVVEWDGDRVTYWGSSQTPHAVRDQISFLFGIDEQAIRVVTPDVGGGFGAKIGAAADELLLVHLARTAGAPLAFTETRSESMLAMGHGRSQWQHVAIGGTRDGRMEAYQLEVLGDSGAYPRLGAILPTLTGLMAQGPYDIPKVEVIPISVVTNTTPISAYRGAGRPEATAALERAVDLFADEIGMDRLKVRRLNLIDADAFPYTTKTDATYDCGDYRGALDALAAAIGYEDVLARQESMRLGDGSVQLGIGISVYVEVTAPLMDAEAASVDIGTDGRATITVGTMPHGQGHETTFATLAADRLGLAIDHVTVVAGDTDRVRSGEGTLGSRSLQTGGCAVARAADDLVELAKKLTAQQLEAAPADIVLDTSRGVFHVAGTPAIEIGWAELAVVVGDDRLGVDAAFEPSGSTFPFGAHGAVVEVDVDTGAVDLVRFVAVDDAGTIVNPLLAEGQIHGGLAQGIAQALHEEFHYDSDGNPLTGTFMSYGIPSAAELPSFETIAMETPTPLNELGAKGIGESGTIGSAPAVQSAVLDALRPYGVKHLDMPLTPERVWQAINTAP